MAKKDHPGEAKVIKGKDEIATTRILPDVSPEVNKDELKRYEGQKQEGQRIATTAVAPIPIPISVSISSPITSNGNGNNSMVPVINKLSSSIKQKYVQICKSKYFLVSKRVMGHEDMQNMSISKQRLEIESGAFVGAGVTREHLQRRIQTQIPARVSSNRKRKLNLLAGGNKEEEEEAEETFKEGNKRQSSRQPFVEDEPFGAGSIITADELCLYHPTVDACWKKLYVEYGMATRYGHLILAGSAVKFLHWSRSKACRKEVRHVPNGRLFIYIRHDPSDEHVSAGSGTAGNGNANANATGKGYIVAVDQKNGISAPTVSNGKGYQLFMVGGAYYHGNFRYGKKHGEGMYVMANGSNYKATWVEDELECCEKCLKTVQVFTRDNDDYDVLLSVSSNTPGIEIDAADTNLKDSNDSTSQKHFRMYPHPDIESFNRRTWSNPCRCVNFDNRE